MLDFTPAGLTRLARKALRNAHRQRRAVFLFGALPSEDALGDVPVKRPDVDALLNERVGPETRAGFVRTALFSAPPYGSARVPLIPVQ